MDCIFCRIGAGEIPAQTVMQDDDVIAFADINPAAPKHLLVTTKRHFETIADLGRSGDGALMARLFEAASKLGQEHAPDGFRLVVNTGADGGQTVPHVHVHVLGGRRMTWPPG